MVLWAPNDGPQAVYEEDTKPFARRREVPNPRQAAQFSEYDWQKGEGPSAPDGSRNMAMPLDPSDRPIRIGWIRRGKQHGAPESAMHREQREYEESLELEKRLHSVCLKTNQGQRFEFISKNRDRIGINPITGEVYDDHLARQTAKALVHGPKSLPMRPVESTNFDEMKHRRLETRRPIREAFLQRQGALEDAPERATASDAFFPPEIYKNLVPVGEGMFDTRKVDDGHAGKTSLTGIGPGYVPTREAASDGIFSEGRTNEFSGKDSESGLGPGLLPVEGAGVSATDSFTHGAAMFDYRRNGFRNGGGWR